MPTLRSYRPLDWEEYIQLDLETGLSSMGDATEDARKRFLAQWPTSVRDRYAWSDSGPTAMGSRFWVLQSDDGAYAGHLWLTEQIDFFSGVQNLFITTVAVKSEFRGRGWGRLLVEHALQVAKDEGSPTVGLGVESANVAAIRLYERLGFRTTRLAMQARL